MTSAKTCAECHAKEAAQWRTTRHATALQTLVRAHKEVDECLSCHSTKYAATKVYDLRDDKIQESVSCETCHGPGTKHSYTQFKADILRKPEATLCVKCHTPTNDPKFDYAVRLGHVIHP